MKLTFTTFIAAILVLFASVAVAQQSEKELRKQIKEKAIKDARKEAKALGKEKWFTQPGSLPLEKQIEKAWMKQYETDDMGYPKYYVGIGNALAGTQSAAKLQASTIAKQDLAGRISSSIASIVETNLSTTQLTADEAATVQETISASTEVISQKLARVITLTELYRKNKKNYECNLRIAYSAELAKQAAQDVIKQSLAEKSNITREKLDKLMNF
ncbi:hypothetical protein [Reichenbachiella versicolor]|uniref:hypothetical protein n=1 Tax=Reichenbachiella versicolor TaxID=1821036 RepID=UPI000D6DDF66|nr:hypothetical protein [Reichenbachiella versicolor]